MKWLYSSSYACVLLVSSILVGCTGNNGQLTVVVEHPDLDYELTGFHYFCLVLEPVPLSLLNSVSPSPMWLSSIMIKSLLIILNVI